MYDDYFSDDFEDELLHEDFFEDDDDLLELDELELLMLLYDKFLSLFFTDSFY